MTAYSRDVAFGAARDYRSLPWVSNQTTRRCLCGSTEPTRRHFLWNCPRTPLALGRDGRKPRDNLEDGLVVRLVDRPPPAELEPEHSFPNIVQALVNSRIQALSTSKVLVATDGGCVPGHAASIGIAVANCNHKCIATANRALVSYDASAWAAELTALEAVLRAANDAEVDIFAIIDNAGVCRLFSDLDRKQYNFVMPKFGFARWIGIHGLIRDRSHAAEWIPSHDKKKDEWTQHNRMHGTNDDWRALNRDADAAATLALDGATRRAQLQRVKREIDEANSWSKANLDRLYNASLAYTQAAIDEDFLKRIPLANRTDVKVARRVEDPFGENT